MAFITDANARRIIKRTEIKSLKLPGSVYSIPIYLFSDYEIQQLLAYKQLMEEPDNFVRETYKPIELKKDSFSFVYEYDEEKPAYHRELSCYRLNQDYENFTIPDSIKYKENRQLDLKRINEFRKWFPTVQELFKRDKVAFVFRLEQKFKVKENPQALERDNSGPMELTNYSLGELDVKIKTLLQAASRFYLASPKHKIILSRFGKFTFLAYSDRQIYKNDTDFTDKEIKEFLLEYDKQFKKPLKILLREFYRTKYNRDCDFDTDLLEYLNFKPCSTCYKGGQSTREPIDLGTGQFATRRSEIEQFENEQDFHEEYYRKLYSNPPR